MNCFVVLLLLFSTPLLASDQNTSRPVKKPNSYLYRLTHFIEEYYVDINDSKIISSQINEKLFQWYTTHCDHNKSDSIEELYTRWDTIEQSCPDMNKNIQNSISNSILKEYDTAIIDLTPYMTNQQHGATGLILRPINDKVVVLGTVEQTSARASKIPYGTIIKSINGKSTDNLCIEDVWDMLKGDIGTKVTITTDKNISYVLSIELPSMPTVSHTIIDDNTVIIKIPLFDNHAPTNITKILQQLPIDMNIVLDLRNNTGGLVNSVNDTLSLFIQPKTNLFSQKSRYKSDDIVYTSDKPLKYIPKSMYVIINQATSAGALLTAKVLQQENATVIGNSKETISQAKVIMSIDKIYSLKMPIAKFYFPDGAVASGTTVTSDIPLDTDSLDDEALYKQISSLIHLKNQ